MRISLYDQHTQLLDKRQRLAKKVDYFSSQLKRVTHEVAKMEAEDASLQSEASKQTQLLQYFACKKAEYQTSIQQCESHLASVGFEEKLRHAAVVENFQSVKSIPSASEADVQFLASFADLEPDVELARKRLQAAKETLVNLKRQYSKMLQAINVPE